MEDIRISAKELLDELENVKSGDLDLKIKLQGKMKKIINLSDTIIFSKDLKDINMILQCYKEIVRVYSFFLKSPELKDRERFFLE